MTGVGRVAAVRAVAKVAKHRLAEQIELLLEFGFVELCHAEAADAIERAHRFVEEALDGVALRGARTLHEGLAWRHVELHARDAGPVLTSVVLLFHQQEQAPQSPERVAKLLRIPRDRAPQPDQGQAALVGESIAHGTRQS